MKVLTVVGNRPQFIKAAAVSPGLRARHEELLVHTGQHFDDELSTIFFSELGLPSPDRQLGIALGSNTSQTARMMAALETTVQEIQPDVVVVYGDTNSTLAAALAAAQAGVPVAHVEAGLRSFDRTMPEELNRVVADHASSLLLCPSEVARENLKREAVSGAIELVGDVMVDIALKLAPMAKAHTEVLEAHGVSAGQFVLTTAHRAGNVDDPARLRALVDLLLAVEYPLLFAVHPRTRARLEAEGLLERLEESGRIRLAPPLGYVEFSALLHNARAVLTDSGGLQKEAYIAGIPCVTIRPNTEWTETVENGWNTLVDLDAERARHALARAAPSERPPLYGDGRAGDRVVDALTLHYG